MRSQCASLALLTLRRAQSRPLQNASRAAFSSTRKVAKVNPIDEYAEDPLNAPPPTPPPNERPRTGPEEAALKAQMLFGKPTDAETRQAERDAELKKLSTNIAGVLVPPRPEEPDNCCMSGCVNCVWDRYRDELEDWAAASAEAREKMKAQRAKEKPASGMSQEGGTPSHVMSSMDDDGGGSETNWEAADPDEGKDLFEGVPVGIREFMKIEKRLKEQQKKSQSAGK
jgi:hypothetical protein